MRSGSYHFAREIVEDMFLHNAQTQ